jgi:hypothetical protein
MAASHEQTNPNSSLAGIHTKGSIESLLNADLTGEDLLLGLSWSAQHVSPADLHMSNAMKPIAVKVEPNQSMEEMPQNDLQLTRFALKDQLGMPFGAVNGNMTALNPLPYFHETSFPSQLSTHYNWPISNPQITDAAGHFWKNSQFFTSTCSILPPRVQLSFPCTGQDLKCSTHLLPTPVSPKTEHVFPEALVFVEEFGAYPTLNPSRQSNKKTEHPCSRQPSKKTEYPCFSCNRVFRRRDMVGM